MIDYLTTAEGWNELLSAQCGDEIVRFLDELREQPPRLASEDTKFVDLAVAALRPLTSKEVCTRSVSVGGLVQVLAGLRDTVGPEIGAAIEAEIATGFKERFTFDLWVELRASGVFAKAKRALGEERWRCTEEAVWSVLSETAWDDLSQCFPDTQWGRVLASRAARSFADLVCYRIAFLAAASEHLANIEVLYGLFYAGNYLLGKLPNKTLIVLVA
jgi:hypothetical protein